MSIVFILTRAGSGGQTRSGAELDGETQAQITALCASSNPLEQPVWSWLAAALIHDQVSGILTQSCGLERIDALASQFHPFTAARRALEGGPHPQKKQYRTFAPCRIFGAQVRWVAERSWSPEVRSRDKPGIYSIPMRHALSWVATGLAGTGESISITVPHSLKASSGGVSFRQY